MPVAPHRPASLREQVFQGSAVVASGILSPRQLRIAAWQRLFRNVYACADLPVTHALRARAAAHFVVPGAVVSGCSAAVLWRLPLAAPDDAVELTVLPGSTSAACRGSRSAAGASLPRTSCGEGTCG